MREAEEQVGKSSEQKQRIIKQRIKIAEYKESGQFYGIFLVPWKAYIPMSVKF